MEFEKFCFQPVAGESIADTLFLVLHSAMLRFHFFSVQKCEKCAAKMKTEEIITKNREQQYLYKYSLLSRAFLRNILILKCNWRLWGLSRIYFNKKKGSSKSHSQGGLEETNVPHLRL